MQRATAPEAATIVLKPVLDDVSEIVEEPLFLAPHLDEEHDSSFHDIHIDKKAQRD